MSNKVRFAILGIVMLGFAFTNKAETMLVVEDMFNYVEDHPLKDNNPVTRAEALQNCPDAGPICAINAEEGNNEEIFWSGSLNKF